MKQMNNNVHRFVSLFLVIVVCMTVMMTGCGSKETDSVDVTYITTKMEGISELSTAKMTMKGIIHIEEGTIPLINKKAFYMIYRASLKADFNLADAKIEVLENTIKIDLPKAELLDIIIDEGSLEFFDKTDSWFNQENLEDTAKAIAAAKDDAMAQPEIEDLKKMAEEQIVILITGLLEDQIGERELVVNIG